MSPCFLLLYVCINALIYLLNYESVEIQDNRMFFIQINQFVSYLQSQLCRYFLDSVPGVRVLSTPKLS